MTDENIQIENVNETKQKNIERTFKWLGFLLLGFGILITLITAFTSEKFNTGWVILVIVGLTIVSGILIFFFKFKEKIGALTHKYEQNIKTPTPVNAEVVEKKLRNEALKNQNYFNEVKGILNQYYEKRGDITLYIYNIVSLYKNHKGSYNYTVIYNLNYPNQKPTILPEASSTEIKRAINGMSTIKDESLEEEHSTIQNPLTGTITEQHRKGPVKKKEEREKQNKPKGDLE